MSMAEQLRVLGKAKQAPGLGRMWRATVAAEQRMLITQAIEGVVRLALHRETWLRRRGWRAAAGGAMHRFTWNVSPPRTGPEPQQSPSSPFRGTSHFPDHVPVRPLRESARLDPAALACEQGSLKAV